MYLGFVAEKTAAMGNVRAPGGEGRGRFIGLGREEGEGAKDA